MTFDFSRDEQAALKAAWATEHGRAALTVVIRKIGLVGAVPFTADPYWNAFNMGRLFCGQSVADAINNPLKDTDAGHDTIDSRGPIPTATERAAHDAIVRATAGYRKSARTKRPR